MRPAKRDTFEEQYLDVLQNIESVLVGVYRKRPDMIDADAANAISGLIRLYQAEQLGKAAPEIRLNPIAQEASDNVKAICDIRLGRAKRPFDDMATKSVEEIVLCLKRIRKSIETWNKEYGRRGYYEFVSQFVM
jgi:hypothetical protein